MNTLSLKQAAEFLRMHPQTLRSKAISGEIPGAKLGKSWVFVEEDLVDYIRSRYSKPGRASYEGGTTPCSTNAQKVVTGGVDSRHQTERRYANLLKLPTNDSQRSTKID